MRAVRCLLQRQSEEVQGVRGVKNLWIFLSCRMHVCITRSGNNIYMYVHIADLRTFGDIIVLFKVSVLASIAQELCCDNGEEAL